MTRPASVSTAPDSAILDVLLTVHGPVSPVILDVTHNTGKMWKGSKHRPDIRCDHDPTMPVEIVADFAAIPLPPRSVDVIVFDPPHILDSDSKKYGMYGETDRNLGDVTGGFEPFLVEADRLLRDDGIILAKLSDMVHDHRYRWQQVDYVNAVRAIGLTPCDMIVKTGTGIETLIDPKWTNVFHTRRAHSYWIVVRKGRCER